VGGGLGMRISDPVRSDPSQCPIRSDPVLSYPKSISDPIRSDHISGTNRSGQQNLLRFTDGTEQKILKDQLKVRHRRLFEDLTEGMEPNILSRLTEGAGPTILQRLTEGTEPKFFRRSQKMRYLRVSEE
jgi:hypothetical protein